MKESVRNLLVGLFVVTSLAVLCVLMVWFGETPSWLSRNEWTLRITGVRELSGVGEGSLVNLNGVQIGRVKNLEFEDPTHPHQGVVIVARIKRIYSVPRGAYAKVYGATLGFGSGHVDIVVDPGTAAEPLDRKSAAIPGEMHSLFGELISKEMVSSFERTVTHFGNLAAAGKPVVDNLADLLERRGVADVDAPGAASRGVTPNIATVTERLDRLLANFNAVLGDEDVQGDVKAAVHDLKDATEGLKETVTLWQRETLRISDNANAGIDGIEGNLDLSFAKLNKTLENLDDSSKALAALLHDAAEGKGTVGLLMRDERFYESAVVAIDRFAEMIATIQRIAAKIERDGYITLAQKTAVGTFPKKFPLSGN